MAHTVLVRAEALLSDPLFEDLVTVNTSAIKMLSEPKDLTLQATSSFLENTPVLLDFRETVLFYVVMNSLNYQFWDLQSGQMIRYAHAGQIGALAMQQAFLHAWLEATKDNREESGELRSLQETAKSVAEYFRHNGIYSVFGEIPSADSRGQILNELLTSPLLVNSVERICEELTSKQCLGAEQAEMLANNFPLAYSDMFLKKAQLTLMFVAGEWARRTGTPPLLDVTAAADYQLPKVLRSLGILSYSPELANRVDTEQSIAKGSAEELAIRAATVVACDQLATHFKASIEQVDFWLWLQRNKSKSDKFHLTMTTHY